MKKIITTTLLTFSMLGCASQAEEVKPTHNEARKVYVQIINKAAFLSSCYHLYSVTGQHFMKQELGKYLQEYASHYEFDNEDLSNIMYGAEVILENNDHSMLMDVCNETITLNSKGSQA